MESPRQAPGHFETELKRVVGLGYLLYTPRDYQAQADRDWPLVLFLHGRGERGNDLEKVNRYGPTRQIEQGRDFPFVLVSPQCPEDERWRSDALSALLDDVTGRLRIDRDRIYLTGLSMGGYGTWALAGETPERFAAIAPVCGGGSRPAARAVGQSRLPTWAFHGAKDDIVPLEESERMVRIVEQFGGDVKLTVYPEAKHDSWTLTYANAELYDWLLGHTRRR